MQPQTKTADANHETTDATVLEMIVDLTLKIDGENGAGLEIAATGGTEIGMDMVPGTGRGVPAESVVAMTDEVSSSRSRISYAIAAMSNLDRKPRLTQFSNRTCIKGRQIPRPFPLAISSSKWQGPVEVQISSPRTQRGPSL